MHTQEAASLKSAVTQLQLHGEIATDKENIDLFDDSDWLSALPEFDPTIC
jgi:hypothetical protein